MEHASLRPIPSRPTEPVDPAAAAGFAAERIPGLDEEAARALARVEIAGGDRRDGDAEPLARARKALRRTLAALPGSGWCERAERSISDRLDGALAARASARLEAHLANCPRCVEHDRRLAQATDALLRDLALAHPGPPAPVGLPDERAPVALPDERLATPPRLRAVEAAPADLDSPARGITWSSLAWGVLYALAVILTLAALALALAGILGADL